MAEFAYDGETGNDIARGEYFPRDERGITERACWSCLILFYNRLSAFLTIHHHRSSPLTKNYSSILCPIPNPGIPEKERAKEI